MKKIFAFLFSVILLGSLVFAGTNAGDMNVNIDLYKSGIRMSVPNEIDLGNVTKGYATTPVAFNISNTGTVNIEVTPELDVSHDEIFTNLMIGKTKTGAKSAIGNFSVNITKPTKLGEEKKQIIYINLDLEEYTGEISQDEMDVKQKVIFWATEN